jgi:hypothetical protein
MCEGHHRRYRSHRFPNREQWLERLEERQRDLEQEAADVADLIRRLREQQPTAAAPQTVSV